MPSFQERCRFATQLVIALIWAGSLLAASSRQRLVALHDAVGTFVDAKENKKYNLFGEDTELIAARVYQNSAGRKVLHVIGQRGNHPWMITERLTQGQFDQLQARIEQVARLDRHVEGLQPVHAIDMRFLQETELPIELKLTDNSRLYGSITACSEEGVQFATVNGTISQIADEQIYEIRQPRGKVSEDEFVREDPNDVRLFFGPTGRTLRKGEGNFSDFYVFFPTAGMGISDDVQLGGGVSLIPGAPKQLLYISPKVRVLHQDNVDMALGMSYIGVPDEFGVGAAFGALSVGSALGGVTVGAAIPFNTDELDNFVAFLFGAEKQVSGSVKLISENWLLAGDESVFIFSGGFRFIGERLTVGLGFFTFEDIISETDGFPLIPWLDFSLSFGK